LFVTSAGAGAGADADAEMQPIHCASSDGAGYLDIDTNDPSNASQTPANNAGVGSGALQQGK
jgi:hypothetical protein